MSPSRIRPELVAAIRSLPRRWWAVLLGSAVLAGAGIWFLQATLPEAVDPTWERIQETGILPVCTDPSWPPFEYIDERTRRERLMAFVSDDDGKTWQGGLMLDEREKVTYPDGVQAPDGTIYIIYDHNRTPNGAVLMATFREEDVRAGKPVTDKVRLRIEIDRLQRN